MANTGRYALLNVLRDLEVNARKIQSLAGDIGFALSKIHEVATELAEAMENRGPGDKPRCGHCGVQGTQEEILEHLQLGYCPTVRRDIENAEKK